jgi:uncharacterized protein YdbL (DUF1318 family)
MDCVAMKNKSNYLSDSGWRNNRQTKTGAMLKALLLVISLLTSGLALAIDLDGAKAQGLVGERVDGYLGSVSDSPSAEVAALIEDVNGKRRSRYQQIAANNNIDLADVEARAGQRAIELTASGGWVFQTRWQQKP